MNLGQLDNALNFNSMFQMRMMDRLDFPTYLGPSIDMAATTQCLLVQQ